MTDASVFYRGDVSTECVFLLSPSYCRGRRATMLLKPASDFATARRLAEGELTLGEAFAFMSGLYFRGKLAYGRAYGRVTSDGPSLLVITPSRGLMSPDIRIDRDLILEFAEADIAADNLRYREPLERDATELAARLSREASVVLLGSVATGKYVDVLAPRFGERLKFPSSFVGRGDMSRGGLLLRSAASGEELGYEVLQQGVRRRGHRPPKLEPIGY